MCCPHLGESGHYQRLYVLFGGGGHAIGALGGVVNI